MKFGFERVRRRLQAFASEASAREGVERSGLSGNERPCGMAGECTHEVAMKRGGGLEAA